MFIYNVDDGKFTNLLVNNLTGDCTGSVVVVQDGNNTYLDELLKASLLYANVMSTGRWKLLRTYKLREA